MPCLVAGDQALTLGEAREGEPLVLIGCEVLLATTPSQLILSRDGGHSWGGLSETTGLLAWPREDRLYLMASDGGLWLSPDRGMRWRAVGEMTGKPTAFLVDGRRMFAARQDGTIEASSDSGRSWRVLARVN